METGLMIAGVAVGALVGLTGVGGGSVMTPLLISGFGVPPTIAVGTDLAAASITKGVGTAVHRLNGTVRGSVVGHLALGSIPGALLGLSVLDALGPASPVATTLIRWTVALCVMATLIALALRPWLAKRLAAKPRVLPYRVQLAIVCGAVIGVLVVISSIGAGAIGATVILLLYPELSAAEIAGTDTAHAVPLTAVAALGHVWLGTVDVTLLLALLMGTVPGIVLGSLLAKRVPEKLLRGVLAATLTFAAAKLVS